MTTRAPDETGDNRLHMRFDKAFPVIVGSEIFGDSRGVARNISTGGMMVEMLDPLPLGCFVTVRFRLDASDADFLARAEVKHSYCFNYARDMERWSARGVGLRFVEFFDDAKDRFEESFTRARVLH